MSNELAMSAAVRSGEFIHPALFYTSAQEYLDALVPFIADGVAKTHAVLVAVPGHKLPALRAALGDVAGAVTMADMTAAGRNPGRILGGVLSAFADKHAHRPVRMVGEPIWHGRSADEYPACIEHEALINLAFAGRAVTVLCPYDATRLAPGVLDDARITHPLVWRPGEAERNSPAYSVDVALARYNRPLITSPAAVIYTARSLTDLAGARRFATRYGRLLGLSADSLADLRLIATELASGSLQFGGGTCRLAFWQHDGHLVCEARDVGRLDDPLAGRRPPGADTERGHGLYLINAIADLVRTHTGGQGTTIHVYLRLGSTR